MSFKTHCPLLHHQSWNLCMNESARKALSTHLHMGADNKLSSSDQRCAVIVTNLSIFRNCGARSGSWFAAIFCLDSVLCTFPCYVTLQKYTLQCQHWDNFRYHSEYTRQHKAPLHDETVPYHYITFLTLAAGGSE